MGIHTTDAIVLRQYPFRETSVVVTCLTDRFGKIKGLVKGLRDGRARYRSAMEPMTVNRIIFYDTRTSALHLISQCELIEPFQTLPQDLETMCLAAFCVELVDAVVEPDEPQSVIFALLKQTLSRLAFGLAARPSVRIHFVLRLLKVAGFHPQLDECAGCNESVAHHRAFWSARQGGLLCEECLHEDPMAEPIGSAMLDTLVSCAQADEPLETLGDQDMAALNARLDEFLRWRLERPLKTLKAQGSGVEGKRALAWSLELGAWSER